MNESSSKAHGIAQDGSSTFKVVSWASSLTRRDGGGQRVRAFLDALELCGHSLDIVPVGLPETRMSEVTTESPLHELKRKYLPVPLRFPISRELRGALGSGQILSLMSGSHRWAINNSESAWVDYPDLWSEYCLASSSEGSAGSKLCNLHQAKLWRRREIAETRDARIVTTASYSDAMLLGDKANWLPNPIYSLNDGHRHRQLAEKPKFGMIANFDYPPNRRAYETLMATWMPVLEKAGIAVVVAGYSSRSLEVHKSIELLGELDNVDNFYSSIDVALAPITHGGGMKVKVVEALSRGIPVVAAQHALDGLPPRVAGACYTWDEYQKVPVSSVIESTRHLAEDVQEELGEFSSESFVRKIAHLADRFGA